MATQRMLRDMASQVVHWQKNSGRHDLPWQQSSDPYPVWLSEIMLQQTQVSTVLAYFTRFLQRFPDVATLAAAPLDEVLGLWSGLGYYSRARNLHACAVRVMALHGGAFPETAEVLQTLPGVGRSTAAAIAALCFGERVAILDGNVKRVLTRWLGFDADLSVSANERQLWSLATDLLPRQRLRETMPCYTQGVMDLGATICSARSPACPQCPLAPTCVARRLGTAEQLPVKTRKLRRSSQDIWMLLAQRADGAIWLSKRPSPGVWADLYCLPLFESRDELLGAVPQHWRLAIEEASSLKHVLTHKDLYLTPLRLVLPSAAALHCAGEWIAAARWPGFGLPAPVRRLLNEFSELPARGGA